ncbi:hypothetical protein [Tritonibacter mobilis]|uniref:hypothetical protein n=2 Tax=Tritonibacter mobilis TaxID=379347 RepID=UPI000806A5B2|nr:hypothetical protein [Tritonibacter mobilis]
MNFSDQINADQDCLTCQQGNLFLADMSSETQGKLQFSGIVNGKDTQTLPVRRVFQLENSAQGTVNQLEFNIGNETMTVIPDLGEFPVGMPEQLKSAIGIPDEAPPEIPAVPYHPNGAEALTAFRESAFVNSPEVQALAQADPAQHRNLLSAYRKMNFAYNFTDFPILHTSELIRETGRLDNRLKMAAHEFELTGHSRDILSQKTERYRSILEAEQARREQPEGEGIFIIALKEGCLAANMPNGPGLKEDLTPAQEVSLADCLAEAFEVDWDAYIESGRFDDTFRSSVGTGALQTGAGTIADLGSAAAELNQAFMNSISGRTARRYLRNPPSFEEWIRMHRSFLREVMSTEYEIKVRNGQKHVVFAGRATLRAHLTRSRYPMEGFRVIDAVARDTKRGIWSTVKGAFAGRINRVFLAFACLVEIKDWWQSEKEDWANLISRLTIVVVTTAFATFLTIVLLGAVVAGLPFVLGGIIIAGVTFLVTAALAVAVDIYELRDQLADFIRFVGRSLFNSLSDVWNTVLGKRHVS